MEQVDLSHPITEDDIANFLLASPDFFERHAEVLAAVQLASPHGNRAIGLQQRQAEMLREKIKGLEARIVDMVGHAHDNAQLVNKIEQLCCELLHVEQANELPARIVDELTWRFDVPQVALRLWDVDARFAELPFAQDVSEDVQTFAASLDMPYCGVNAGFPVMHWLNEPEAALSLALIPLNWPASKRSAVAVPDEATRFADKLIGTGLEANRAPDFERNNSAVLGEDPVRWEPTFEDRQLEGDNATAVSTDVAPIKQPTRGLLVLASPDPRRFHADMGTDFLRRLADLCGAALSRLRSGGEAPGSSS